MFTRYLFLSAFGSMLSYIIIIGDSFSSIISQLSGGMAVISDRRFIIVLCVAVVVFPLTLLKSINK